MHPSILYVLGAARPLISQRLGRCVGHPRSRVAKPVEHGLHGCSFEFVRHQELHFLK